MSNRVKRDVRLEVAPGALGVTFEADYNGCAGKFFQQTNNRHDQSLSVFQLSPPSLLLTQFYFLLAMHSAVIKRFVMTPAGLESPLAKRVRKGYVLVAINDTVITKKKHSEVKRLLQSSMNRRRTLLFRDGSVHYSNKDVKGTSSKSDSSHIDIEVRAARLNRETSKKFAEKNLAGRKVLLFCAQ